MALREVTRPTIEKENNLKPNDLQIGETIEGYLIGVQDGFKYKGSFSLLMQQKDSNIVRVSSHGNIRYAMEDGLIVGEYTVITKTGTKRNSNGQTTGVFRVQQDDADFIQTANAGKTTADLMANAQPAEDDGEAKLNAASMDPKDLVTTNAASRNAGNGVTKKELEAAAIKNRTAQLKAQAAGK